MVSRFPQTSPDSEVIPPQISPPGEPAQSLAGPINWTWFHQRRRGLQGALTSGFLHYLGYLLLTLMLVAGPRSRPGVELQGLAERDDEVEIPPVRVEQDPWQRLSSGRREEWVVFEEELPEPLEIRFPLVPGDLPAPDLPQPDDVRELAVSSAEPAGSAESPQPQPSDVRDGASFLGLRAAGNRFVFVVDCSLSMRGARWDDACAGLMEAVESLGPSQSFYVLFFDIGMRRMFAPQGPEVQQLVPATAAHVEALRQWIPTVPFGYETDPLPALRAALELRPDAIFLLSDGEFAEGTTEVFRRAATDASPPRIEGKAAALHTVALHGREGERTLKQLAAEHGGTYRYVPDPRTARAWRQGSAAEDERQAIAALNRAGAELEIDEAGVVRRVVLGQDAAGLQHLPALPELQELCLAGCRIGEAELDRIAQLKGLRLLVLSQTGVNDDGLAQLGPLVHLEKLFLEGTEVTDEGMRQLTAFPRLRVLSTPGRLTDAGVVPIASLRDLEVLYLAEPGITDAALPAVARLPALRRLVLTGAGVTDEGLVHLAPLIRLESLHLGQTDLLGRGLVHLQSFGELRELSLDHTQLEDGDLGLLRPLSNLERLDLAGTRVGDQGVEILAGLPSLRSVILDGTRVTPSAREWLNNRLK